MLYFCDENNSTCVLVDNSLIIVDNKQPTDDKKTTKIIEVMLSVFFYISVFSINKPRPYVDWIKVNKLLVQKGYLS